MSKILSHDVAGDNEIGDEEIVNQMFAEMKQANEKMMRDQEEIDRLNTETNEILSRLKAA